MKFAKWGNSLALRVPADVVAELGLSSDDEAQIKVTGKNTFEVVRDRRRQEAIDAIRKLAMPLPEGYKFNRDQLYDRFDNSILGRSLKESTPDPSPDSQDPQ